MVMVVDGEAGAGCAGHARRNSRHGIKKKKKPFSRFTGRTELR